MIPKIIHYCWFGKNEIPNNVNKCIESWKKRCPNYKIVCWNENNYQFDNTYVKQAYEKEKYAFVTDYVRLDVISKYGGIYLDTDVELLKSLDELLELDSFFGLEEAGRVNTGLCFGSKKNNELIEKLKYVYHDQKFIINGRVNTKTCVEFSRPVFKAMGMVDKNCKQVFDNGKCVIFPTQYFCPKNIGNGKIYIDKRTYSIHHFDSTWKSKTKFDNLKMVIKVNLRRSIDSLFGVGTYNKIKEGLLKR